MNWQRAILAAACGLIGGLITFSAFWVIIPTNLFSFSDAPSKVQDTLLLYFVFPLLICSTGSLFVWSAGGRWIVSGGIIAPFVFFASLLVLAKASTMFIEQLIVGASIVSITITLLLASIESSYITLQARVSTVLTTVIFLAMVIVVEAATFVFFAACMCLPASMALFSSAPAFDLDELGI